MDGEWMRVQRDIDATVYVYVGEGAYMSAWSDVEDDRKTERAHEKNENANANE